MDYGTQFRCRGGEIFNVYDSGKFVPQGRQDTSVAREVASRVGESAEQDVPVPSAVSMGVEDIERQEVAPDRRVFIVYGHDSAARDGLELMLRRWELQPIVLQNLPAAGDTVIEKLERYLGEHGNVGFSCVLLTPDDIGASAGQFSSDGQVRYRARQNVILELGMVLSRLGRPRVAILYKESVELPSDIGGLLYVPFKERIEEVQMQLARELRAAGYSPSEAY